MSKPDKQQNGFDPELHTRRPLAARLHRELTERNEPPPPPVGHERLHREHAKALAAHHAAAEQPTEQAGDAE